MKQNYEIIAHSVLEDLNIFVVDMVYCSPHIHKEIEFVMLISGELDMLTEDHVYTMKPGEIMLLNPRQVHELRARTEETRILVVQVASQFCSRIYPMFSSIEFLSEMLSALGLQPKEENLLRFQFLQLAQAYFRRAEYYEFDCMARLFELFGTLLRIWPCRILSEAEQKEKYLKSKRLGRIMDHIEEHYSEKVLLSDIAKDMHLTVNYLSHLFKETLGMSFQRYVALMRFEKAKKLLVSTTMTLTEICISCGFSDRRYLKQMFQEQLNCTPIEYREKHPIMTLENERDPINLENRLATEQSLQEVEELLNKITLDSL